MLTDEPLLLDTHVWIWVAENVTAKLSTSCAESIRLASRQRRLLVSAISVWEVANLDVKKRISLYTNCLDWVYLGLKGQNIELVELLPETGKFKAQCLKLMDEVRERGRPRAVFHRDRVGELRAKGFSWNQIARKLNTSPSVAQRAFLSEEHTLPKTTPARTAIRTGNESAASSLAPSSSPPVITSTGNGKNVPAEVVQKFRPSQVRMLSPDCR